MDTCKKYIEYISNREKGTSTDKSDKLDPPGERYSITAVDHYGATGDFYLLQFFAYNCFLYRCTVKEGNPKRIAITDIKSFNHKLQNVYKYYVSDKNVQQQYDEAYFDKEGVCVYDSYYDEHYSELKEYNQRLAEALENIMFDDSLPVYVCGCYIENQKNNTGKKAVWYALLQKAAKVVRMERKQYLDRDEKRRVFDIKAIRKQPLNTSVDITIADCFGQIGKTVFVPLVDETLDSMFFGTTTWRKILADTGTDMCCQINGVPCRCAQIQINMDIYNNVFCTTTDENGKTKCTLINDALGVMPELETMQQKEVSQPKETSAKPERPQKPILSDPAKPKLEPQPDSQSKPQKPQANSESKAEPLPNGELFTATSTTKDIHKGETGYSFSKLFKPYLIGAKKVILQEPHLSDRNQLDNLESFAQLLVKIKDCEIFVLKTRAVEIEMKNKDAKGIAKARDVFDKKIKFIQDMLKCHKIKFVKHEVTVAQECHDRHIYADSGYRIVLGYGLHFLENEQWSGLTPQEERPAYADTTITYHANYDFDRAFPTFPEL